MRINNPELLKSLRGPGRCDWCKKEVRWRDPHHVFSRGAGQLDIRCNIAILCAVFSGGDNCHHRTHTGEIDDSGILAIVAARENCLQGDIETVVYLLRDQLPKGTTAEGIERAAQKLNFSARGLLLRELELFRGLLDA